MTNGYVGQWLQGAAGRVRLGIEGSISLDSATNQTEKRGVEAGMTAAKGVDDKSGQRAERSVLVRP